MPGDYSRKTFDKKKHYSAVLMQQGRVQLDADWNEKIDIQQYRTFTETKDVIGDGGVPKKGGGFQISLSADGTDLTISPGRIYVAGLLCEREPDIAGTYRNQPYYPGADTAYFKMPASPPSSPPAGNGLLDGSYLVYLKAWQREINYLDDPLIQEKALGEADTTTRLQTVWQVRLLKVQDNGSSNCTTQFPEWDALTAPPTGNLNAQATRPDDDKTPCELPPTAGYTRLENQSYRIQVQTVDQLKKAKTFKWSRDNASIETTITKVSGNIITVSDTGKDDVLGFAASQWVEIVDDASTLNGSPYPMVQIDCMGPDTRQITLKTSVAQFNDKPGLKLRRWDMEGTSSTQDGIPVTPDWIDVEGGIQVKFDDGSFEPGDFWLITARTATGNIEWPVEMPGFVPVAQPRAGIQYAYCRLAFAKVQGGVTTLEDCRDLFPSLTDICAEDICFDNDNCNFPGATNVQEALDILCAANDLKDHNKHLHGSGVVCGLKVKCGANQRLVIIEPGYALDCEGNVIRNKTLLDFPVMEEIAKKGLLQGGEGEVCLTIAYNGVNPPVINVEPFIKQSFWDEILEGTLLKDFVEGCIRSLIQSIKSELPIPLKQVVPVPVEQRRLTALINLLSQLINSKSGQYAFISGDRHLPRSAAGCAGGNPADKQEDELLYCFYEKLKALLASETYCAQYAQNDFPAYTLTPGLKTIFGTPLKKHRRLRLNEEGTFAFTCNGDAQIFRYNLKKQEFDGWLDFPALNVQIQDVCVSADQKQLYVVAVSENKNSLFGIASLTQAGTWSGPFVVPGLRFVTLGVQTLSGRLFGVARGAGFYEIMLKTSGVTVRQLHEFNATGLMVLADKDGLAYAASAAASAGTDPEKFTSIKIISTDTGSQTSFDFTGTDADNDLLFHKGRAYVTGDSLASAQPSMRILGMHTLNKPVQTVDLEETGSILRLAAVQRNSDISDILVSFSDQSKVLRVMQAGNAFKPDAGFRIPVQLFPMDIAINQPTGNTVYVLNIFVNTLTAIDVDKVLRASNQPDFTLNPPEIIANYRKEAIAAYRGLFKQLLQYLKDCFCDKFLIDCPQCGENDKVYLGTLKISKAGVHHICNFSKRKYVKTFRTVEYWLSTIPVLPVFKKAFTVFCCSVLDDLNRK